MKVIDIKKKKLFPKITASTANSPANNDTITISSIIAIIVLCNKAGEIRKLPFYRHTFVSTVPLGPRSQNHIFSLYPLLETDEFLSKSTAIEDCFGLRPQNTQQYMYSKSHIRAVISATFSDEHFPWLGFDSKTQQLYSDNSQQLNSLIAKSNSLFANLRTAVRDVKLPTTSMVYRASAPSYQSISSNVNVSPSTSQNTNIPVVQGVLLNSRSSASPSASPSAIPGAPVVTPAIVEKPREIPQVLNAYGKLNNKGLIPSWMKSGGSSPRMLAQGWGAPTNPNRATVESFMCKLHLQGFLDKQQIATRSVIGGNVLMKLPSEPSSSAKATNVGIIEGSIKEYLSAYKNMIGSDVSLSDTSDLLDKPTTQVGGTLPMNNHMIQRPIDPFEENKGVQRKLGDEATDWLNAIEEKMQLYNATGVGDIVKRQYILEDIQMKTQILALLLSSITGMTPTVIPRVSSDNLPGDPSLLKGKSGGHSKPRKTYKIKVRKNNKTQKVKRV